MATRDYPNKSFAWYNDDKRLAIVSRDSNSSDITGLNTEPYDSFQGAGSLSGTISAFANHNDVVTGTVKATCSAAHGLSTNDVIQITSSPDGDYSRSYSITKIDDDEFYFTNSYFAEASGTFLSLVVNKGLRITFHSKYEPITLANSTAEMSTSHGLDTGMQNALLCYVKSRLFEDQGDIQKAQYFRQMYEKSIKQYPSRKSGVRQLSVPRM